MSIFWSPEVWFRSYDLLVVIQILQSEITVRNKIEVEYQVKKVGAKSFNAERQRRKEAEILW